MSSSWFCVDLDFTVTPAVCNGWRAYQLDYIEANQESLAIRMSRLEDTSPNSASNQQVLDFDARLKVLEAAPASTSSGFLPEITPEQGNDLALAIIGVLVTAWAFKTLIRFISSFR